MTEPRSIGFLLHPGEQAAVQSAIARAQACGFTAWTALDDPEAAMAEHGANTALLVTLGGDGTFLYGARLAAPRGIPVVGVNRGRLGFLNDVEIDALPAAISRFAAGDYTTQRRSLLETNVGDSPEPILAVNEIVVRARDVNVVRLRVDVDGDLLGAFDADGIVVATATGSTAYALSAGGPPVDPRVSAVVVVPLAAHAVISRPVVIPELLDVRVTVERGRVFVAADGRSVAWLGDGESVVIRPGPILKVVRFSDSPSFQSRLRQKFRYGIPHKDLLLEPVDDETGSPDEGRAPGGVNGPS
ncbi:MAG: NAD(+)/NADH kinase [Candidatus Dormiibacterota bacterium]